VRRPKVLIVFGALVAIVAVSVPRWVDEVAVLVIVVFLALPWLRRQWERRTQSQERTEAAVQDSERTDAATERPGAPDQAAAGQQGDWWAAPEGREAERAAAEKRQADLARATAATAEMTGAQFERLVGRLLERDGCQDVRVGDDAGADVAAVTSDGRRVVVQCTRYAADEAVRDAEVQHFLASAPGAEVRLFVTSSYFAEPAQELAADRGVVLVDGRRVAAWMTDGTSASPLPRRAPRG
jgi:restriction system protein